MLVAEADDVVDVEVVEDVEVLVADVVELADDEVEVDVLVDVSEVEDEVDVAVAVVLSSLVVVLSCLLLFLRAWNLRRSSPSWSAFVLFPDADVV